MIHSSAQPHLNVPQVFMQERKACHPLTGVRIFYPAQSTELLQKRLDADHACTLWYGISWYLTWQHSKSCLGAESHSCAPAHTGQAGLQEPMRRGGNLCWEQAQLTLGHSYFISKYIALISRYLINRKDLSD